jgi:hypothetical protein
MPHESSPFGYQQLAVFVGAIYYAANVPPLLLVSAIAAFMACWLQQRLRQE